MINYNRTRKKLAEEIAVLEKKKAKTEQYADLVKYKADIERYLPDVPDLHFLGRYCTQIGSRTISLIGF